MPATPTWPSPEPSGGHPVRVGTEIEGTWRIVGRLGGGGQASVYRVVRISGDLDDHGPQQAALKVCNGPCGHDTLERCYSRFRREGEKLQRIGGLRPAHLAAGYFVDFYGHLQLADGRPAILLELLQGTTAREVLGLDGVEPWPIGRRIAFVGRVARAVAFLHQEVKIWHRDLSPQNILCRGDDPAICDFGAAREGDQGRTVMVNPAWAAPEQFYPRVPRPAAVDAWTLGLLAWLACRTTGSDTPEAEGDDVDPAALAARDLEGSPFQPMVLKCLSYDPKDRPDARQVAELLLQLPLSGAAP